MPSVSAILLAAGTASRMGSPKQLMSVGGKPLLLHALENVQAAGVGEVIVVLGSEADAMLPHLETGPKLRVAVNEAFGEGMSSSLQKGIAALDADSSAAFVVLADQPFVKPATLDRMIEDYRCHRPQILIPLYRGFRGNPVLLDRSVFPEIAALTGDMGCRAIFGDHVENVRTLETGDPGILLDADRPEDVQRFNKIYAKGSFDLAEFEAVEQCDLPAIPDIVVVGTESVATAVATIAKSIGFRVTVVDPVIGAGEMPAATAILRTMDFSKLPPEARQFCVIASMGRFDEEAIGQALKIGMPYVALVANKKRSQEVLHSLGYKGLPAANLAAVRTKPGLAIGAKTPKEIGLSIVAEIVGEFRR